MYGFYMHGCRNVIGAGSTTYIVRAMHITFDWANKSPPASTSVAAHRRRNQNPIASRQIEATTLGLEIEGSLPNGEARGVTRGVAKGMERHVWWAPWFNWLVPSTGGITAAVRSFLAALSGRSTAGHDRRDDGGIASIVARTVLLPVFSVGLMTLVLLATDRYVALKFELIVYLIPVVIAAARWGLVSAMVSALAAAAMTDFFFLPPFYSFAINDPNQIVDLVLFVFVALVTSNLAARLRSEVDASRRREYEIHNLYEFSRRLAQCSTASDLVRAIQEYLSVHLGCQAHLIRAQDAYDDIEEDPQSSRTVPERIRRVADEMIAVRESGSRLLTDPDDECLWVVWSVTSRMADHGILAVNLGHHSEQDSGKLNDRIDALLSEASVTLSRIDAASALANANVRVESDALKAALIGTASHELRSPVAAILGSTSVLDQMPALQGNDKLRALVGGMHREAKRLDCDIQNLLDTVRITDNGIKPHLSWIDPADIIAAAIKHRSQRLLGHRLKVDVDPNLPLVHIDTVLIEQAVGQLLENAVKYSPPDSDIAVVARADGDCVALTVSDNGVGLTEEEAAQLFRRAVRGRRHIGSVPGLGLGLWIAKIFVSANGGTLLADSAGPGRGTTMSIRLPVRESARSTPRASAHAQAS
jgi:K+-sensing histidine kinase KdpD